MAMERLENVGLGLLVLAVAVFAAVEAWDLWRGVMSPLWVSRDAPAKAKAPAPEERPLEELGALVFRSQGCLACHNLDLKGGVLAPSLDNVGVRRDAQWLREKILEPHAKLPGTFMPAYAELSETELNALVAFLGTLTPARPSPDNTGEAKIEIPTDEQGNPRFTPEQVERGKLLFQQQGCVGCHAINGLFPGGPVGPNLTREAQRKRTDEWQRRHLIDPVSVYVVGEPPEGAAWPMPGYGHLPPEDLKALVAFLQSLK